MKIDENRWKYLCEAIRGAHLDPLPQGCIPDPILLRRIAVDRLVVAAAVA